MGNYKRLQDHGGLFDAPQHGSAPIPGPFSTRVAPRPLPVDIEDKPEEESEGSDFMKIVNDILQAKN